MLYYSQIGLCVKWTYNVHIYIYIEISKFEKHETTSLFRYETFYYL